MIVRQDNRRSPNRLRPPQAVHTFGKDKPRLIQIHSPNVCAMLEFLQLSLS
jgi:hypothetical protein